MPKKFIKKYLPHPDKIKNYKHLRFFGDLIHDPNLWHLNRRSVSGAFAIGLFFSFVPMPIMPFQMVWSAATAIYFRLNLPIAVVLVWISNPFTWAPLVIFCYQLGAWILDVEMLDLPDKVTPEWVKKQFFIIWQPFLLGSFLTGGILALLGYFGMQGLWRLHVVRAWERRKQERKQKKKTD